MALPLAAIGMTLLAHPHLGTLIGLSRDSSAATQASLTLVRGPYLQQVEATQAIVVWATRESGAASVQYRTGSATWRSVTGTSTFRGTSATGIPDYYQHEVPLTGLSPGTTYQYDLRVGAVDPTPGIIDQFRSAPATGTGTVRLLAFGDSGTGSAA